MRTLSRLALIIALGLSAPVAAQVTAPRCKAGWLGPTLPRATPQLPAITARRRCSFSGCCARTLTT